MNTTDRIRAFVDWFYGGGRGTPSVPLRTGSPGSKGAPGLSQVEPDSDGKYPSFEEQAKALGIAADDSNRWFLDAKRSLDLVAPGVQSLFAQHSAGQLSEQDDPFIPVESAAALEPAPGSSADASNQAEEADQTSTGRSRRKRRAPKHLG